VYDAFCALAHGDTHDLPVCALQQRCHVLLHNSMMAASRAFFGRSAMSYSMSASPMRRARKPLLVEDWRGDADTVAVGLISWPPLVFRGRQGGADNVGEDGVGRFSACARFWPRS